MSERPCYWIKDEQLGRLHIPGCMGAAVSGPSGCTCGIRRERADLESRMKAMEQRIERLENRK